MKRAPVWYMRGRRNSGSVTADGSGCWALCVLRPACVCMPGWMSGSPAAGVGGVQGAASLVGSSAALGYILVGLCAFLLGVCVTVLLYRLRRREARAAGAGR